MPIDINYVAIMPEIILAIFGILIMLLEPFSSKDGKAILPYLALVGTVLAALANWQLWGTSGTSFNRMLIVDPFSTFFRFVFLLITAFTVLISIKFNQREGIDHGEYYALVLFAAIGMSLMAASNDLIMIFLGLEILSIATYVLAGFKRADLRSNESSLKYFLLGSFSTAFLLYGIALLYGATRSTNLQDILQSVAASSTGDGMPSSLRMGLVTGLALLIVGFGFKVATAPFHIWTPDVYEGAPTPVTTFMAVGPKAAGFAAFLRVLFDGMPALHEYWTGILWFLAILTMTVGNVVALVQSNLKRMLAYSSIAHAGYILVGIVSGSALGVSAVLFYILVYTVMNVGAFAVLLTLSGKGDFRVTLEDYTGIGFKYPFLSFCLSFFLISLIGIPATAGFMGKFYLFNAALNAGYVGLVIVAVINSAISVFYYSRPIVAMFFAGEARSADAPPVRLAGTVLIALILALIGTLWLGLFPAGFLSLANKSTLALK
jgi:NADH-quinone oxidoreductase subunit N